MNIFKKIMSCLMLVSVIGLVSGPVFAGDDWSNLKDKKKTTLGLYMTPKQADDYIQKHMDKTLFVDIRTPEELMYLGTPTSIDAHVPYELVDTTKWNDKKHAYSLYVNDNFVADIDARMKKKGLSKDDTVILMCRSGSRSAKATNLLAKAGYTHVYNLVEGFEGDKAKSGDTKGKRTVNGWKNAGLPWTYHLDKDVMYLPKK